MPIAGGRLAMAACFVFFVTHCAQTSGRASSRRASVGSVWSWVNGNSTGCAEDTNTRCAGSYGLQRIFSPTNLPGARCCAHTFQSNGTLFLFGGYGYDAAGNLGYLNDLWAFNPVELVWTWLAGSNEVNQPNTDDWPASRHYAAYGFDHEQNYLYVFGGMGGTNPDGDILSDLWRLALTADELGNVTAKAELIPASSPPPGRYWMNFWFANGEFYVHSGVSEGKTGLNDMWVFHPAKGADGWERLYDRKGMEVRGVYYGDHQFPGERENAFTSVREADNSLWMFGGSGYGTSLSQRGDLNDVWRFDTDTRKWHFEGGTAGAVDDAGSCGELGQYAATNIPQARHAGFNAPRVTKSGRMYVLMGEHNGEKDIHSDVWSLQTAGPQNATWAVWTDHCDVSNTNSSYNASNPFPGSRFAGNVWVVEGPSSSSSSSSSTTAHRTRKGASTSIAQAQHAAENNTNGTRDRLFVYGGWGIDDSQQQRYTSDMWMVDAN